VLQRSGLSTIGDILRHRRLSLFGHVACTDPGVPAHDALRVMVDTYEGRKASWRIRPLGRPLITWLNKDTNTLLLSTLCRLWRSEIAMGHGAAQRSLGIRDDDDDDDDAGLCQKWRVKLILEAPTGCPEPGLLNV